MPFQYTIIKSATENLRNLHVRREKILYWGVCCGREGDMTVLCVLIVGMICFCDLWIKHRVEKEDSGNLPKLILGNRILIQRHHNCGAILNLGQRWSRAVTVVSVLACAALAAIFLFRMGRKGGRLIDVGLAFLLGGAFSNTYDRLKRKYVVDYFSFQVKWEPFRRIVFNLADFAILIGAVFMVVSGDSPKRQ